MKISILIRVMRIFIVGTIILLLFPGMYGITFAASDLQPEEPNLVYLPLVSRHKLLPEGISGCVTENGQKVAGVSIRLDRLEGSTRSTIDTKITDNAGVYNFQPLNSLNPGQSFQIVFTQTSVHNPDWLSAWYTKQVTSYTAGSSVDMGCFDVKGLSLISPSNWATTTIPVDFTWEKRSASPDDSYVFMLYDPSDFDPYLETDPPLGFVDQYTLDSLPPGFTFGVSYGWEIWIRHTDGSFGIVLETRRLTFAP